MLDKRQATLGGYKMLCNKRISIDKKNLKKILEECKWCKSKWMILRRANIDLRY